MNIKRKRVNSRIYLDWASAAPVSRNAEQAFIQALSSYGNPSSPHTEGAQAHAILSNARKTIARLTGVKPDGVILTSGATESNALAIQGHVKALLAEGKRIEDLHLLYLPTAHASVVETMDMLKMQGAQIEHLAISEGVVDLRALKAQLRPETVLVSIDVICGETGTKYDTRDVRRVIDLVHRESTDVNHKRPILYVDASQAPFTESIDCNHLGADLLTLDAQKIGGVRGIGVLIRTNPGISIAPLLYGGGQEQGMRAGTENPALAAAFAVALADAQNETDGFKARAAAARNELQATLSAVFLDMSINVGKEFSPHILNLSFQGRDTDYAVMLLSQAGYAVSTKSACETDALGSRVVFTLSGSEARALSTLRISWGPTTQQKDVQDFGAELIRTIQFLDSHTL